MSQKTHNSIHRVMIRLSGHCISFGFIATFILVLVTFCSNTQKTTTTDKNTEYRPDTIASVGIYFEPPPHSTPLPEDSVSKLNTNGYNEKSPLSIEPVKVYIDSSGLICTISKLKGTKVSDNDSVIQKYSQFIESTFSDTIEVVKNKSDLNGFQVTQFKIAAPEATVFKIIYNSPANDLFQIDYVIYNRYLDSGTVTNVALSAQSVLPISNR